MKAMTRLQDVYLTKETFEKDLEECLTILSYPTKAKKYYTCEHISAALEKRIVRICIIDYK